MKQTIQKIKRCNSFIEALGLSLTIGSLSLIAAFIPLSIMSLVYLILSGVVIVALEMLLLTLTCWINGMGLFEYLEEKNIGEVKTN